MTFIEIARPPMPAAVVAAIHESTRYFRSSHCSVMLSQDPLWHISISHPHRYPNWDEIKTARYQLVPDEITMAMILPPKAQYVNVHPNCFHLHEIGTHGA